MMNVPALIAAIAFAVLVIALAWPLFKLGRVFDKLRESIEKLTDHASDTLSEATQTVKEVHGQVEKVDALTTSSAQIAQDLSALSTLATSSLATPLIKLSALSYATRQFFHMKDTHSPKVKKSQDGNSHHGISSTRS